MERRAIDRDSALARIDRRAFLGGSTTGIGTLALASLLDPTLLRAADAKAAAIRAADAEPLGRRGPPAAFRPQGQADHLPVHGRRAVAPGDVRLQADAGQDARPADARVVHRGQPIAQLQGQKLVCLAPQHPFQRCGASGQEISTIFPHLATVADEICIIRSMVTEAINHDPAHTFMNTGTTISGRPAMGSWITYGLGSESDDLPGFVVLTSDGHFGQAQPIASRQWHSGFLPSRFQGVGSTPRAIPVLYMGSPTGHDREPPARRGRRRPAARFARGGAGRRPRDRHADRRVRDGLPDADQRAGADRPVATSPSTSCDLYGTEGGDGSFAANCLLARRLAERGVRFIQLYHRDWDHHGAIKEHVKGTAAEVDQGAAALIKDLKQRGMLDDTLVIWGGEFGRTPMAQGNGRDHHIKGFSIWMAGGGIKGGITHGATDEFGYNAVQDVVHVHDLHATMLALFGIDHQRLVYRFQGRDFRLTDVAGQVVKPILA